MISKNRKMSLVPKEIRNTDGYEIWNKYENTANGVYKCLKNKLK